MDCLVNNRIMIQAFHYINLPSRRPFVLLLFERLQPDSRPGPAGPLQLCPDFQPSPMKGLFILGIHPTGYKSCGISGQDSSLLSESDDRFSLHNKLHYPTCGAPIPESSEVSSTRSVYQNHSLRNRPPRPVSSPKFSAGTNRKSFPPIPIRPLPIKKVSSYLSIVLNV